MFFAACVTESAENAKFGIMRKRLLPLLVRFAVSAGGAHLQSVKSRCSMPESKDRGVISLLMWFVLRNLRLKWKDHRHT